MNIRQSVFIAILLAFLPPVSAGTRTENLYASFIAPCCWSKNLMEHNSQVAAEMRGQIDLMVQAGRSDEEIKSIFVAKYGKRVLALPEGDQRVWLFGMPMAAGAAGLIAVSFFLKRSLSKERNRIYEPA